MTEKTFESYGSVVLADGDDVVVTNVIAGSGMQLDVVSGATASVYIKLTAGNAYCIDVAVTVSAAFVLPGNAYAIKVAASGGAVTVGVMR